jgi:hypothetical protein
MPRTSVACLRQTERQDWEHEKIVVLASLQADRARMAEL